MNNFADATDRLTGAPFALAWAAAMLFSCAVWGALAWGLWQVWRLWAGN